VFVPRNVSDLPLYLIWQTIQIIWEQMPIYTVESAMQNRSICDID
jgi:hypothetical protein